MDSQHRELVIRCLSGAASAEDRLELQRWIAADHDNADYFRAMQKMWDAAGTLPDAYDPRPAFESVLRRAEGIETPVIPLRTASAPIPPRTARRRVPRWGTLTRAAAVLAAALAGAAVWQGYGEVLLPEPALESYATAAGQRAKLTFSDGSTVLLGPESEVRAPIRFRRGTREVHLRGTALFEVRPNARRPFLVHAGGSVTRVLGTRFVVRAYSDEEPVSVAVAEGRVAVRGTAESEEEGVVVSDGELAQVDTEGVARVVTSAGVEPLLEWTEGRLVFRDRPLGEVARDLERWYDVEIRVPAADLAARRVSLSFEDAPLDEVLGALQMSLGFGVDREGRTVTLHPR